MNASAPGSDTNKNYQVTTKDSVTNPAILTSTNTVLANNTLSTDTSTRTILIDNTFTDESSITGIESDSSTVGLPGSTFIEIYSGNIYLY